MEHEPIKYLNEEFEDGELSDSNDSYTPLQRPNTSTSVRETASSLPSSLSTSGITKMEDASELEESLAESDSDSGSDCDFSTARNRTNKKKVPKIKPLQGIQIPGAQPPRYQHSKYNIWSSSLQEEVMENLKECGVDQDSGRYDRSCESYDYSLKYRLNGENSLKRRQSYSDDSEGFSCSTSNAIESKNKRFRANSLSVKDRKNVRLRLGNRNSDDSSNEGSGAMNSARNIVDLSTDSSATNDEIAKDIANKLYEEKDDLMVRVVNTLGRDLSIKLFKETQKIESDGGMLIVNGMRRRTPGGVFLFLLKNCDEISKKQKKDIFLEEERKTIKSRKISQALKRDLEVEELKKSLKNENELPVLGSRSDHLASSTSHLGLDTHVNLSNPPPSPVTDFNRENSDFDSHPIQHMVNVTSPEKDFQRSTNAAVTYDDDILSMNCDEMDLF
ncbi:phosphorylated adapter RNA export protein [Contarinia nasturtii]|uniref:phosphorylated adapter RNA export protein n=1 Tax=Contarinia nasturtii TaxID=265458 RepID=UPI0012D3F825|nr:phosphorylated adapter RNA export protein [Contarinia nasturtii]